MRKIKLSPFSAVSLHVCSGLFIYCCHIFCTTPGRETGTGSGRQVHDYEPVLAGFLYANAFVFIPSILRKWGIIWYILTLTFPV
jgi:hypothetical protein